MNFKTAGFQFRLFFVFLLIGFCTDVLMYYLLHTDQQKYLSNIFNFYSLIEACFFYWFIIYNAKLRFTKVVAQALFFITVLFWFVLVVIQPSFFKTTPGQLFDPFYEVGVAFLSGFTLLQLVERESSVTIIPVFWILLAIFFYCFCTFFIMGFLNTLLSQKIWFLNNIINIITYVFYSIGLWNLRVWR